MFSRLSNLSFRLNFFPCMASMRKLTLHGFHPDIKERHVLYPESPGCPRGIKTSVAPSGEKGP